MLTCMIPRAARGSMAARMSYLDDLNEDEAAAAKVAGRTNAGKSYGAHSSQGCKMNLKDG